MNERIAAIGAGQIAAVYYLCGERYAVDQVTLALRRGVLGTEGANAFNHDALEAQDGVERILAAARTVPMLGPRRLVHVRGADALGAEELARLLPYVKDPAPFTCLLLTAESADLRFKFFSELKKHGVVQRFEPLKERQVPAWLASAAKQRSIALRPGAAERIAGAVGCDMAQLSSALEQLALYVGTGKPVAPEDVEELLAQTRQHSIFELTNAVGRGQRREALLILRRMLQDREPGVRIVAMLARHVRQIWSAKEMAARRAAPQEIAAAIGAHPYFVQDIVTQGSRISEGMLERTHHALFEADRALKSSRLPDAAILEQLVLGLCPPEGPGTRSRGG